MTIQKEKSYRIWALAKLDRTGQGRICLDVFVLCEFSFLYFIHGTQLVGFITFEFYRISVAVVYNFRKVGQLRKSKLYGEYFGHSFVHFLDRMLIIAHRKGSAFKNMRFSRVQSRFQFKTLQNNVSYTQEPFLSKLHTFLDRLAFLRTTNFFGFCLGLD